ncbi:hypothetical protein C8R43DRAFT_948931 [Mycena crocata]|nr:hypothetical protein C8R43DRAFT_948931 [Mycena crocata]
MPLRNLFVSLFSFLFLFPFSAHFVCFFWPPTNTRTAPRREALHRAHGRPFTVKFPKPAPAYPKIFKSRGRAPFRVVHLSDVHIDCDYTISVEANYTKPIYCRNFTDSPTTPTVPADPNGNSHCDSPVSLANPMLAAVERLRPKFSIFTGDVAERAVWRINQSLTLQGRLRRSPRFQRRNGREAQCTNLSFSRDTSPVNLFARSTSNTATRSGCLIFKALAGRGGGRFSQDAPSKGWGCLGGIIHELMGVVWRRGLVRGLRGSRYGHADSWILPAEEKRRGLARIRGLQRHWDYADFLKNDVCL